MENVDAFDQPGVEDYKKILHEDLRKYIVKIRKKKIDIRDRRRMDIKILVAAHKNTGCLTIQYFTDSSRGPLCIRHWDIFRIIQEIIFPLKSQLLWIDSFILDLENLDCEYIGLCHYRRYFGHKVHSKDIEKKKGAIFTKTDYEKLLTKYDVILPKTRNYYIETVRSQYEHAHFKKDLDETEKIIAENIRAILMHSPK